MCGPTLRRVLANASEIKYYTMTVRTAWLSVIGRRDNIMCLHITAASFKLEVVGPTFTYGNRSPVLCQLRFTSLTALLMISVKTR